MNYELLFRCIIAVDILLCAAIVILNLLLLLALIFARGVTSRRVRTRNAMLVSVCVADLLVGVFTYPIYIHSYHTGTLFHSCEMHIVMQLIGDYSQDFVCFWTLVTLGSVYVYRLMQQRFGWDSPSTGHYDRLSPSPSPSKCRTIGRVLKQVLLVGWPWLGTLLIPVPILMSNVEAETRAVFWDQTFCPLHTAFPWRMLVLVLVFYLPMALLLLLCVALAVLAHWDATSRPPPPAPDLGPNHSQQTSAPREQSDWDEVPQAFPPRSGLVPSSQGVGESAWPEEPRENGHTTGVPVVSAPTLAALREGSVQPAGRENGCGEEPTHVMVSAVPGTEGGRDAACHWFPDDLAPSLMDPDPAGSLVADEGEAGSGRGRGSSTPGAAGRDASLEKPGHVLVPFLVTALCALPLMIGWWFYESMSRDVVIAVSVTLSRLYLLRAALLPLAWFTLPDLRHSADWLWARLNGGREAGGASPRAEMGEFSVAYTTLRETEGEGRAEGEACEGSGNTRRQNPFDAHQRV